MKKTLAILAALFASGAEARAQEIPCGAMRYLTTIDIVQGAAVSTTAVFVPYCDARQSIRRLPKKAGRTSRDRDEPPEEQELHRQEIEDLAPPSQPLPRPKPTRHEPPFTSSHVMG